MRTKLPLLMIAVGTCCCVFGQVPLPSRFEVVSIKPSTEINTNKGIRYTPDGGFRASNYSLKDLIRFGWDVRAFKITGGPAGWTQSGTTFRLSPTCHTTRIA